MGVRAPGPIGVAAVALAVGGFIGVGTPLVRASMRPWRLGEFDPAGARMVEGIAAPKVDAPSTQFAFGTMGEGAEETHEFVIRNSGDAPLKITRGATSCSCTVSDFESSEGGDTDGEKLLEPGAAAKLRLKWRGKKGGAFRQQATVFTNDPRRPEIVFVVEGFVVPIWKAEPKSIVLTSIPSQGGVKATSRIFTYGKEPPQVAGITTPDAESPQAVSFTTTPLSAEEIARERGATGGILLEVEILPGVPLGPLRKTIEIDLRLPDEVKAEVTVEGTVAGDLALAGQGWDSSRQVLQLGTISGRTGMHTQVFITAKGTHRDAVHPVVRDVVPPSMEVVVGEGKPMGSGAVVRIPLTITFPAGSPPCNHLGSSQAPAGRIVLDTGHPDSPTMTIPVSVAIGP
jgi:hypothetical protein